MKAEQSQEIKDEEIHDKLTMEESEWLQHMPSNDHRNRPSTWTPGQECNLDDTNKKSTIDSSPKSNLNSNSPFNKEEKLQNPEVSTKLSIFSPLDDLKIFSPRSKFSSK